MRARPPRKRAQVAVVERQRVRATTALIHTSHHFNQGAQAPVIVENRSFEDQHLRRQ